MRERIANHVRKVARKHHYENEEIIEDFINSAHLTYNYYVYRGMNENKAYRYAILGLGSFENFFKSYGCITQMEECKKC